MTLNSLLNRWKKDPSIGPNISSWLTIPIRHPTWSNLPDTLDTRLSSTLETQGINQLFAHQAECWQLIQKGKNLVISPEE
jgi:DEAD/DEAH box helicase domain-containing protein